MQDLLNSVLKGENFTHFNHNVPSKAFNLAHAFAFLYDLEQSGDVTFLMSEIVSGPRSNTYDYVVQFKDKLGNFYTGTVNMTWGGVVISCDKKAK